MTKLRGPALSLDAHGRLGRHITIRRSPSGPIAQAVTAPTDPRTNPQIAQRSHFAQCAAKWHTLSPEQREYYRQLNPTSNFNAAYINFMGVCLMAAYLNDLTDVELTDPQDLDHLIYDGPSALWKNKPAYLIDLSDLEISDPQDGDHLIYDGPSSLWKNKPAYLIDLSDVQITAPQNGDALIYNTPTSLWKNQPAPAGTNFHEGPCTEAKKVALASTWEQWNLSAIVPAGTTAVQLHIRNESGATRFFSARKKGSARLWSNTRIPLPDASFHTGIIVEVSTDRIIEIYCSISHNLANFNITGWWSP